MTTGAIGLPSTLESGEKRSLRFYRPELDVVRFLAFFFVLLSHYLPNAAEQWTHVVPANYARIFATAVAGCSDGLNLFFTLSAYLIVELLLREREATGTVQIKQFYIRRVLRIWPLYFAGLAIALALAFHDGEKNTIIWVGLSFAMLGNWFLVFHTIWSSPMSPFGVSRLKSSSISLRPVW
jgi:peptidoglycan/LPS O-acetylase OafA/YrhL